MKTIFTVLLVLAACQISLQNIIPLYPDSVWAKEIFKSMITDGNKQIEA